MSSLSLVPRPTHGMFCMWTRLCLALITSMVLAAWMSGDVCVNWNKPKVCKNLKGQHALHAGRLPVVHLFLEL